MIKRHWLAVVLCVVSGVGCGAGTAAGPSEASDTPASSNDDWIAAQQREAQNQQMLNQQMQDQVQQMVNTQNAVNAQMQQDQTQQMINQQMNQ